MAEAKVSGGIVGKVSRVARILAWTGLALAAGCGVAALLGGLGSRWGWWNFGLGIKVLGIATLTDLAAVLLTLIGSILASRAGPHSALIAGLLGLGLSVVVAGPPLYLYRVATSVPAIHDLTTDAADPPRFVAVLALRQPGDNSLDYTARVAAEQKKGYPDLARMMLAVSPAAAFERALAAARAMGWEIVASVPAEGRIEATDTTTLFGFKDDVVIRVAPSGSGSRVDVRSASRVGQSDIGVNAKRIRAYLAKLASG
jgi:uncharacterized protein (DUF1499 family)